MIPEDSKMLNSAPVKTDSNDFDYDSGARSILVKIKTSRYKCIKSSMSAQVMN
jgi:hypothetical protein